MAEEKENKIPISNIIMFMFVQGPIWWNIFIAAGVVGPSVIAINLLFLVKVFLGVSVAMLTVFFVIIFCLILADHPNIEKALHPMKESPADYFSFDSLCSYLTFGGVLFFLPDFTLIAILGWAQVLRFSHKWFNNQVYKQHQEELKEADAG